MLKEESETVRQKLAGELYIRRAELRHKREFELAQLELERQRLDVERGRPWWQKNIPWFGPTVGAFVAVMTLILSNASNERSRAEDATTAEKSRVEEAAAARIAQQVEADDRISELELERETQIILQSTQGVSLEQARDNILFFAKLGYIQSKTPREIEDVLKQNPIATNPPPIVPTPCGETSPLPDGELAIIEHNLASVLFCETSNVSGGLIVPKAIVIHNTGGNSFYGALQWLRGAAGGSSNRGSSAHLIIGKSGEIVQLAQFDKRTWHAGSSKLGQLSDINSHAIGIELVNTGYFRESEVGLVTNSGKPFLYSEVETEVHPSAIVGPGDYYWEKYPDAQIEALVKVLRALSIHYRIDEKMVVGHEDVDTRGWKTDPGPAFPWERVRTAMKQ